MCDPVEVARAVLFLASDESPFKTGTSKSPGYKSLHKADDSSSRG